MKRNKSTASAHAVIHKNKCIVQSIFIISKWQCMRPVPFSFNQNELITELNRLLGLVIKLLNYRVKAIECLGLVIKYRALFYKLGPINWSHLSDIPAIWSSLNGIKKTSRWQVALGIWFKTRGARPVRPAAGRVRIQKKIEF